MAHKPSDFIYIFHVYFHCYPSSKNSTFLLCGEKASYAKRIHAHSAMVTILFSTGHLMHRRKQRNMLMLQQLKALLSSFAC
jgi:hypothetical protein